MTDGASPRRCNEAPDRTAVVQDRICPSGSSALAASPCALPAAAPSTGCTWAATAGSSNAASPGCTPSNGSAPATNTAPTSTWACSPAPRHRRNESASSVRVLGRLCGRHRPGERLPQPPDGLQIGRGGGLSPLAGSLPGLGVHLLVAGLVHPVVQQPVDLVQAGDVVAGPVAVPGDLYQELAPDRLEPPLDPVSAQRRGTLRVSLIPSPAGPRISGSPARQASTLACGSGRSAVRPPSWRSRRRGGRARRRSPSRCPGPSSGSSWFHRPADRTARAGSGGRWPARLGPASVC